jgi:hypothetical protein
MDKLLIQVSIWFAILLTLDIVTFYIVNPRIENPPSWIVEIAASEVCGAEDLEAAFALRYFESVGLIGGIFGPLYGVIL